MTVEVDGDPTTLDWDEVATEPGWCKLDWVVVDPEHQRLTNASNVIDVTWESPDGDIVPLDGYLDAYFQEVYLDAGQLPTFTKVVQHVSGDALDDYVDQLEGEVRKYLDRSTPTTARPRSGCTTSSGSPAGTSTRRTCASCSTSRPRCSTRSGR